MICTFVILGKVLVSDEYAACAPGVKCFSVHYSQNQSPMITSKGTKKEGAFEKVVFSEKTV